MNFGFRRERRRATAEGSLGNVEEERVVLDFEEIHSSVSLLQGDHGKRKKIRRLLMGCYNGPTNFILGFRPFQLDPYFSGLSF